MEDVDILGWGILQVTKCCAAASARRCSDICWAFRDSETGKVDVNGAIEFARQCFERTKKMHARKDKVCKKGHRVGKELNTIL